MRIGLLTQWFDPEPGPAALPGVLARGLVARGHEVQVLTGFPNYPSGTIAEGYRVRPRTDEHRDGVDIRRTALYASHDASAVRRFANYASFGLSAATLGVGALRHVDAVWVNYSPITTAWPMWVNQLLHRVPSVVHVLDLWPDTVLAGGFGRDDAAGGLAQRVLHAWCNRMYRTASSVAYISPGVGSVLQDRGVPRDKLAYVPMWADESLFRPAPDSLRPELGVDEDEVVLLYAGALGEAQGLESLVEACALVRDPRFVCLVAGSGTAEESLRRRADELSLTNLRFLGRVPSERMTALTAAADLAYIGLRPHPLSSVTMPSKTQANLAAGKPLLVAATGDVADVARDSGAAFVTEDLAPAAIAATIEAACRPGRDGLRELGAKARSYYEHTFSVDEGVRRIEGLLLDAAGSRP